MFTHSFSSAASPGKQLNEEPKTQADPDWLLRPQLPYEMNSHTHTLPSEHLLSRDTAAQSVRSAEPNSTSRPFHHRHALSTICLLNAGFKNFKSRPSQTKNNPKCEWSAASLWFSPGWKAALESRLKPAGEGWEHNMKSTLFYIL